MHPIERIDALADVAEDGRRDGRSSDTGQRRQRKYSHLSKSGNGSGRCQGPPRVRGMIWALKKAKPPAPPQAKKEADYRPRPRARPLVLPRPFAAPAPSSSAGSPGNPPAAAASDTAATAFLRTSVISRSVRASSATCLWSSRDMGSPGQLPDSLPLFTCSMIAMMRRVTNSKLASSPGKERGRLALWGAAARLQLRRRRCRDLAHGDGARS